METISAALQHGEDQVVAKRVEEDGGTVCLEVQAEAAR